MVRYDVSCMWATPAPPKKKKKKKKKKIIKPFQAKNTYKIPDTDMSNTAVLTVEKSKSKIIFDIDLDDWSTHSMCLTKKQATRLRDWLTKNA